MCTAARIILFVNGQARGKLICYNIHDHVIVTMQCVLTIPFIVMEAGKFIPSESSKITGQSHSQ